MNVPQLRFDGFDGEWENTLLKNEVEFFDNKRRPVTENLRKKGVYPYYGATGVIDYVEDYVLDGEFLLLAEDGANILTRSAPVVYKTKSKFWVNNHAHVLKTKEQNDFNFFYQVLENINYIPYNSGTAQPKLNLENVKKIQLNIPSYAEQQKIGSFFTLITQKIEKQQEKIEKLEQFKKGMMQKIFSQELRFKDEDGGEFPEWKSQILDELGSFHKGSGLSKSHLTPSGQSCILYGELYTKYSSVITKVYSYCNPEAKAFLGEVNDVLIPSSGETAWDIACASALNLSNVVLGGDLNVFRPYQKVDGNFISYQINSIKKYELSNLAQGASVVHLYSAALKKLEVFVPVYEEQLKISEYLLKIDAKIEREKEKLMVLEEQKKGFMQGMFV